mgnify:CR=1 FL=1
MYNEEVKQRYLGSLSKVSAVKMATSVFNTTEIEIGRASCRERV